MSAHSHVSVLIVGGGPAGLRAATELAPRAPGTVLVVDREEQLGGIPRHSDHPGYGMRDLGRFLSGPAYARRLVAAAQKCGARLRTSAMVTGWADERTVEVTSREGQATIEADAIVLATGAREHSRAARWIPGDRPAGVFTTGELQQQVHVEHLDVGTRAVVVGAELVSWSAVLTLLEAGVETAAMVTRYPRPDSYAAFSVPGRLALGVPVRTSTRVVRINGHGRVTGVEVEQLTTGAREVIPCDTVVLTGDWVPDHELFRSAGIALDPATRGPLVDMSLRTDRPGVFAAGNVVHPVDTADIAALGGAHVADAVLAHLHGGTPARAGVRLTAQAPLRWVAPSVLRPGDPAPSRGRLAAWSDELRHRPVVEARQGGRVVGRVRTAWPAAPGRVFRIPYSLLRDVHPGRGDVTITLG